MKRNLLITLAALVLAGGLIILFRPVPTSPSEVAGISQKDFQRIRQVTRHAMWRAAFPDFSTRTIIGAPRSLYRLITSRIEQIDVLPLNLFRVQVKTGSDLHWYAVEKYQKKPGQNDWRASTKGPGVIGFNLRGLPAFPEIRVDGGLDSSVGGFLPNRSRGWSNCHARAALEEVPTRPITLRLPLRTTSGSPMRFNRGTWTICP